MNIKKLALRMFPGLYARLRGQKAYLDYYRRKHTRPDQIPKILEKRYYEITGHRMDMQHPRTYSEKLQWLKLYDPSPDRSRLADKVAVRDWVREQIGEEYLIPVLGVYERFEDIDFDSLPDRFVIKTNHSSGWNIIVKDKADFDRVAAGKKVKRWLSTDFAYWKDFELHYSAIPPKILIEPYLEDKNGELRDYKFLCFDGEVKYVWVDFDRYSGHKRNIYDMDWKLQPWNQNTYGNYQGEVPPPENFELMKQIAKKLCQGFIHVRVDLFNVDGKIYFGEMTFTSESGIGRLYPYEYETEIGKLIKLPIED